MSAPRTTERNAEPFDRPSPTLNRVVEGFLRLFPARHLDEAAVAALQAESERTLLAMGADAQAVRRSRTVTPWTIENETAPPDAWGGEVLQSRIDGSPLVVLYQDSPLTHLPSKFLYNVASQLAVDHMYGHLYEYHVGAVDWGEEVACRWQYRLLRERGGVVNTVTAFVVVATHRWHKGVAFGNYGSRRSSDVRRVAAMVVHHLPNLLTSLRIALAVAVIAFVLGANGSTSAAAAVVASLAGITDAFDGWLARRLGRVTALGQTLDPLADKVLVGGALLALALEGRAPWWCVIPIVARDMAVTSMRLLASRRGKTMPATVLGKFKMQAQVAMIVVLAVASADAFAVRLLLAVAVALTLVSGGDYMVNFRRRASSSDYA